MSRGPGRIQRIILALVDSDVDGAWTVTQLCEQVYRGINRVEKKHRVAVARALRRMPLPGTWRVRMLYKSGGEYCLYNNCSLRSSSACHGWYEQAQWYKAVSLDDFMERWDHRVRPGGHIYEVVLRNQRWRDASKAELLDLQIEDTTAAARLLAMAGTSPAAADTLKANLKLIAELQKQRDELARENTGGRAALADKAGPHDHTRRVYFGRHGDR